MSAPHGMETRTRKALVTLIVLALLAVVLQSIVFSGASFTASKTNTANAFIAGTFGHVNNKDGQLVIDAVRLRPGQSLTGTFTVTGTGDVAGAYTLSKGAVVDTPASPGLSTALTLLVEDITTLPAQVLAPAATVATFSGVGMGTIASGATRTYRLTLAYPVGAADSQLQGDGMTLALNVTGVAQ